MKTGIGKEFTKEDRKNRTIYIPQMLEYHSKFLQAAFENRGYKFGTLHSIKPPKTDALRYISNDYCYPTVLIVGQFLEMIQKNKDHLDEIAFMEPQAGGACRAGNIYNAIIEVIEKLGYDIPVLSLNYHGEEKNSGFCISPKLVYHAATAVCCGDLLMLLYQQTKPYECQKGQTDIVYQKVETSIYEKIKSGHYKKKELYREMIAAFLEIEVDHTNPKKKVAVTGELYIKFSSLGNHNLENYLYENDCEPFFGGFLNYCIFVAESEKKMTLIKKPNKPLEIGFNKVISIMVSLQKQLYNVVKEESNFSTDLLFPNLSQLVEGIISKDCITGDGWLIAAEVIQAISQGSKNVLIVHPFGCMVSHVCERGILKNLKAKYKDVSIQTIEYDYDSSDTLRESRILMALQ